MSQELPQREFQSVLEISQAVPAVLRPICMLKCVIKILGGESDCPSDFQTVPAAKLINCAKIRPSIETVPMCRCDHVGQCFVHT